MSLGQSRIESAVAAVEARLAAVESHAACMRAHLAACDWRGGAAKAQDAAAAFEGYLDAIQEMYRTMARA